MSIISEVKCARCDRKYSGVRSRCPYCGARRIGRGKYSEEEDNTKGKMLVGVLIMAVLVVAAGVLLFTTPAQGGEEAEPSGDIETSSPPSLLPGEDDTTTIEDTGPPPSVSTTPPPSVSTTPPTPTIETVTIRYSGSVRTEFTARVGERVPLSVRIDPLGIEAEIIWASSNRNVFEVVPNIDGTQATVTAIAIGTETLTVTVGDVTAECIVRVRAPR